MIEDGKAFYILKSITVNAYNVVYVRKYVQFFIKNVREFL